MVANWPEKRPGRERPIGRKKKKKKKNPDERMIQPFPVYDRTGEKDDGDRVAARSFFISSGPARLVIIDSIDQFVRSSGEGGCEI